MYFLKSKHVFKSYNNSNKVHFKDHFEATNAKSKSIITKLLLYLTAILTIDPYFI